MFLKHRNEQGSLMIVVPMLLASLTLAMTWVPGSMKRSIKSVQKNDPVLQNRDGFYNWVRYLNNSGMCDALNITMNPNGDPTSTKIQISPSFTPTPSIPELELKANNTVSINFIELAPPGSTRLNFQLLGTGTSASATHHFRFVQKEKVSLRGPKKRGVTWMEMQLISGSGQKQWESGINVFYSTEAVTVAGRAYVANEVVQCFGWNAPAFMCNRMSENLTWDVSEQKCVPSDGEYWQP